MGSPFSKGKLIANCFMIGLLLNIASNAIMLVYTTQVLKINLFADWAGSLLLMLLGNVFGIAAGLLIGTNQKTYNARTNHLRIDFKPRPLSTCGNDGNGNERICQHLYARI